MAGIRRLDELALYFFSLPSMRLKICEAPDIFQKLKSLYFSWRQLRYIADVFRFAAKLED